MNRTSIGYSNGVCTESNYASWNPIVGCSKRCPDCWARLAAARSKHRCEKCGTFTPHLHAERLGQVTPRQQPKIVLVGLMGEMWDDALSADLRYTVMVKMFDVRQHLYVVLSQKYEEIVCDAESFGRDGSVIYYGMTVRRQADVDRIPDLPAGPNWWLSAEPLEGPIDIRRLLPWLNGVIVGHNRKRQAPGTTHTATLFDVCRQCRIANVPCFLKQVWTAGSFRHSRLLHAGDAAMDATWRAPLLQVLPWQAEWERMRTCSTATNRRSRNGGICPHKQKKRRSCFLEQ